MKSLLISLCFTVCFLQAGCNGNSGACADSGQATIDSLAREFKTPGSSSGVSCWWWWLNGNVTRDAIVKDLNAMKARNFYGAMIFDAGGHNQRGNKNIPDGPLFGSKEWTDLFVFALDEAKRLGLVMGFNIQSGWNLGGPNVTPEYAAKQLTYSETKVNGGKNIEIYLEKPHTNKDYYRDVAVLAFPLKQENKTGECINFLDRKLGFHEMGGSAPDCRFLLNNSRHDKNTEGKSTYTVNKDDIINLTAKVDENGKLKWTAPEGEWAVMRIGFTCTQSRVSTSSNKWQGNVLDYLSREAFDFYWNGVVEPIFKAAGSHVGTTLKYMETDSWECGGMNWTDNFGNEFREYRGYDIIPYLPVVAGYIIDNVETTDAFLADFRKTIGEMAARNHYARFAEYAHKYNMGIMPESAGPHAGPLDGIKNYGFSDIVMSEFWAPSPHRPRPEDRFFLKQASSAAHIYGKKIVGAESFTTIGPHWNDELWHDQKPSFDHEICAGLNRLYFHTFTCSPKEMGLPGQEYFAGTHVNPQVTWWNRSSEFIDYIHRTQMIMQNGRFVADILYYYGDHVPNIFPFKHSDPAGAMPGYDYDVTDETVFLQLKTDNNGMIVVPSGLKYRVLVLPDHKTLSLAVLEKIEKLLKQGANITGFKPEHLVSMEGGKKAQAKFHRTADRIWGTETADRGERKYGKGTVSWGMTASEWLTSKNIRPDFTVTGNTCKTDYDYIHYMAGGKNVYFITNMTEKLQKINCRFRVSGFRPELWDAVTGEIRKADAYTQADGMTTVPLALEPCGAVIVVFNDKIDKNTQGCKKTNCPDYREEMTIKGPWTVHFDPKMGAPETVTFPELSDWTQNADRGIKYYSGTAVYEKTFKTAFVPQKNRKYVLQLGSVKDVGIATVKINGREKRTVWTCPFRVDITGDLKEGNNTMEIEVINSWFNRVMGDQLSPDKKQYTSTNIVLLNDFRGKTKQETALEPSGLMGPVKILSEEM